MLMRGVIKQQKNVIIYACFCCDFIYNDSFYIKKVLA